MKRARCRGFFLAVALASLPAPRHGWAGPGLAEIPAAGGSWIPCEPASPAFRQAFLDFYTTPGTAGPGPSILVGSPLFWESENLENGRALGFLQAKLPPDFVAKMKEAVIVARMGEVATREDAALLSDVTSDLISAREKALPEVEKLARRRAKQIASAVVEGKMKAARIEAAWAELSELEMYGETVGDLLQPVKDMVFAANKDHAMAIARKTVGELGVMSEDSVDVGAGAGQAKRPLAALAKAETSRPSFNFPDPKVQLAKLLADGIDRYWGKLVSADADLKDKSGTWNYAFFSGKFSPSIIHVAQDLTGEKTASGIQYVHGGAVFPTIYTKNVVVSLAEAVKAASHGGFKPRWVSLGSKAYRFTARDGKEVDVDAATGKVVPVADDGYHVKKGWTKAAVKAWESNSGNLQPDDGYFPRVDKERLPPGAKREFRALERSGHAPSAYRLSIMGRPAYAVEYRGRDYYSAKAGAWKGNVFKVEIFDGAGKLVVSGEEAKNHPDIKWVLHLSEPL